jgi:hypothetical protein
MEVLSTISGRIHHGQLTWGKRRTRIDRRRGTDVLGKGVYLWRSRATAFGGSPVEISMALSVNSSVETLGNLLHLIRHSLGNPAEAGTYLDIADKVLVEIASNRPLTPAGSVPPVSGNPSRPPAPR